LLLGAFYATFLPSVTAISALGLIFLYWAEKYSLLRRHSIPPSTSALMQIEITDDFVEFMIMIFNVFYFTSFICFKIENLNKIGNIIWESMVFKEVSGSTVAALVISALFYIFPVNKLFDCCII
jgi:hypothetical protein